jgi:hypothetical protein
MFESYENEPLSSAGKRRRESILGDALLAAKHRRVRRLTPYGVTAGIAVIASVLVWNHRVPPNRPTVVNHDQSPVKIDVPTSPKTPSREIVITRIETDPTLLDRLRVPPQKPTWRTLSDEELLKQLAASGRPAGLAYVEGRTELLWR